MATSSIAPTVTSTATPVSKTDSTTKGAASSATTGIADNFQTFLTLLTTQLQNQNPLDPLDTNQFTQQLVQFAGVEQQLKTNDQLSSLVSLQTTTQATQALNFVGTTVVVDGNTAPLTDGHATWALGVTKPATVAVTISNAAGQAVFTNSYTVNAGANQVFAWDGKGSDGAQLPDGDYTMSVTGVDASGLTTPVTTGVQGVVDSADVSQTPPLLSIGTQTFTTDKIKKVVRASS